MVSLCCDRKLESVLLLALQNVMLTLPRSGEWAGKYSLLTQPDLARPAWTHAFEVRGGGGR